MDNCPKGLKYALSGRMEIHPCVLQDIGSFGAAALLSLHFFTGSLSRASGTADHVQSLDNLLLSSSSIPPSSSLFPLLIPFPPCPLPIPLRSSAALQRLSSETNLTSRQIEFWLRRRQKVADFNSKRQLIDKFTENVCRLVIDTLMLTYGVVALWSQPWTWSLPECWKGWPNQPRELSIRQVEILTPRRPFGLLICLHI